MSSSWKIGIRFPEGEKQIGNFTLEGKNSTYEDLGSNYTII